MKKQTDTKRLDALINMFTLGEANVSGDFEQMVFFARTNEKRTGSNVYRLERKAFRKALDEWISDGR